MDLGDGRISSKVKNYRRVLRNKYAALGYVLVELCYIDKMK